MAKILIAEDERDIRDLIALTLQFSGHEVVATANGEEALEKAQEIVPDLIMMDVRMPRMTGYEACTRMKEIDILKPIPVVFLSAKGQESEISAGLEAGAVEYILKPFAPMELVAKVAEILEKVNQKPAEPPRPSSQPAENRTVAQRSSPPQPPTQRPEFPARPDIPPLDEPAPIPTRDWTGGQEVPEQPLHNRMQGQPPLEHEHERPDEISEVPPVGARSESPEQLASKPDLIEKEDKSEKEEPKPDISNRRMSWLERWLERRDSSFEED